MVTRAGFEPATSGLGNRIGESGKSLCFQYNALFVNYLRKRLKRQEES